ncbi:MAG: hypothetical protein K2K56_09965 [Lachnospiraceae bacterium]|nr:hypothetical protein [Lachnospiraceae bacterium]
MSKLHLDFKNRIVGVEMEGESSLHQLDVRKSQIRDLIPEEIYDIADCFTFDFNREIVCINRPIVLNEDEEISLHIFVPIKEMECKGISNNCMELLKRVGIR